MVVPTFLPSVPLVGGGWVGGGELWRPQASGLALALLPVERAFTLCLGFPSCTQKG